VPTAYVNGKKTSIIFLTVRVVQTGKVLRSSLYVNDIEQEAIIAMNICL